MRKVLNSFSILICTVVILSILFFPPRPKQEVLAQCLKMLSVSSTSSAIPLSPDSLTPQRQDVTHGQFSFRQPDGGRRQSSEPQTADAGGAPFTDAFALACQLLVEFCSFPRYQSSLSQV